MRKLTSGIAAGGLALALAACGEAPADEPAEGAEAAATVAAAAQAAPAADNAAADDAGDAATDAAASAESTEASAAPAAGAAGDLTAYVGKFPADKVGGVAWGEHPMVVAGLRRTLTDAAVRQAMQSPGGPTAPIATYQGKVGSWGCQQHNCGDHQWATLVDPKTGATDVCYHNAEQTGDRSRWFLAGGGEELRPGNCSVV